MRARARVRGRGRGRARVMARARVRVMARVRARVIARARLMVRAGPRRLPLPPDGVGVLLLAPLRLLLLLHRLGLALPLLRLLLRGGRPVRLRHLRLALGGDHVALALDPVAALVALQLRGLPVADRLLRRLLGRALHLLVDAQLV